MTRKPARLPTARDVMASRLLTVSASEDIGDAVRKLLARGVSGAPVVDADGALVGVLSEHDCIRVTAEALVEGWPAGTAGDHMSKEAETVPPELDVLAVASRFANGRHRRLLVAEGPRVVGVISRRDLMQALQDLLDRRAAGDRTLSTYQAIEERHRRLD